MPSASDQLYKDYVRRNMARFATKVKVREILPHLPSLTQRDRDEVEAKRETTGNYNAMQLLLDHLKRRENWPDEFIKALEECKLHALAQEMRDAYEALKPTSKMKPQEVGMADSPGAVTMAHVHPPPAAAVSVPAQESIPAPTPEAAAAEPAESDSMPSSPAMTSLLPSSTKEPISPVNAASETTVTPEATDQPEPPPDMASVAESSPPTPAAAPVCESSAPASTEIPEVSQTAKDPDVHVLTEPDSLTHTLVSSAEVSNTSSVSLDPQPPREETTPVLTKAPIQVTSSPSSTVNSLLQAPEETSDPTIHQICTEQRPPTPPEDEVVQSSPPQDGVIQPPTPPEEKQVQPPPIDEVLQPIVHEDEVVQPPAPPTDEIVQPPPPKDEVVQPTSPEDDTVQPPPTEDEVDKPPTPPEDEVDKPPTPPEDEVDKPPTPPEDIIDKPLTPPEDEVDKPLPKDEVQPPPSHMHDITPPAPVPASVPTMVHQPPPSVVGSDVDEKETLIKPEESVECVTEGLSQESVTETQLPEPCSEISADLDISTPADDLVSEANSEISSTANTDECPEPVPQLGTGPSLTEANHTQEPMTIKENGSPSYQPNGLLDDQVPSSNHATTEEHSESLCCSSLASQEQSTLVHVVQVTQDSSVQNQDGQEQSLMGDVIFTEVVNHSDTQSEASLTEPSTNHHSVSPSTVGNEVHLSKVKEEDTSSTQTEVILQATEREAQEGENKHQEKSTSDEEQQSQSPLVGLLPALQNTPLIPAAAAVGVCALVFAWKLRN